MKILICSDGTAAADAAVRLGRVFAEKARAEITLLGIAEHAEDEVALRQALDREANVIGPGARRPQIVVRSGEPTRQILSQTSASKYDLVVIGGPRRESVFHESGHIYEIIKTIEPPVLIAIGNCERLSRFLVCTGGKRYIDEAVRLTGVLAAAVGARVTLLHVMAEPPAIYADLVRMEEDVTALLQSGSELGQNLKAEKAALEKLGVIANVRVRHGFVIDQVFDEVAEGDYDLIVSGSSRARGPLRHYIMGDLTRSILNRASCPVLVARSRQPLIPPNFVASLRERIFPKSR